MKGLIIIALLLFIGTPYSCTFLNFRSHPDWEDLKEFTMYDVSFTKPLNQITDAELDTTVSVKVPVREVRHLLKRHCKTTHRMLLYKTMTFCVLKFHNSPDRRFILSTYGGFFTDLHANRMYLMDTKYRDEWMRITGKYSTEMMKTSAIKYHPEQEAGIRAYYDSTETGPAY